MKKLQRQSQMLVQKLNGLKPVTDVIAENADLFDESSENLADDSSSSSASHLDALTDKINC